jgi:hypothetical protein
LSPNDKNSSLNSIDFSSVGNSISSDSNAFSKIHRLSKISSSNITTNLVNDNLVFSKINNLYLSHNTLNQDTYQYGSNRQHNYSSLNSFLPSFSTLVDTTSFKQFFDYSLNTKSIHNNSTLNYNFFNKNKEESQISNDNFSHNLTNHIFNNITGNYSNYFFKKFLMDFNKINAFNSTTDGKNNTNPLSSFYIGSKKKVINLKKPTHFSVYDDLTSNTKHNFYT